MSECGLNTSKISHLLGDIHFHNLKELNLRYNPGMKNTGLSLIKNSFITTTPQYIKQTHNDTRKYSHDSNTDKKET